MKHLLVALLLLGLGYESQCQGEPVFINKLNSKKGDWTIYWGWNHSWYSRSDIHFSGDDYNFTLEDVKANDRQSKFNVNTYFNPSKFTIPQYNFRIGYFFHDKLQLTLGMDHMKYVVQQNQNVIIDGEIDGTDTEFDKTYHQDLIELEDDFLKFEHTDGLNYANIELRKWDDILVRDKIKISVIEGIGAGVLIPKTNATLINNPRNDEFHLAGFGVAAVLGLNVTFFEHFYFQSELKEGYINMPDIRTTPSSADKAKQQFFFAQWNVVFGAIFQLDDFKCSERRIPKSK